METPHLNSLIEAAPYRHLRNSEATAELSALKQRCEDLELMLRAALIDEILWKDINPPDYNTEYKINAPGRHTEVLEVDGTGLPLLSDEARAALRKAVSP